MDYWVCFLVFSSLFSLIFLEPRTLILVCFAAADIARTAERTLQKRKSRRSRSPYNNPESSRSPLSLTSTRCARRPSQTWDTQSISFLLRRLDMEATTTTISMKVPFVLFPLFFYCQDRDAYVCGPLCLMTLNRRPSEDQIHPHRRTTLHVHLSTSRTGCKERWKAREGARDTHSLWSHHERVYDLLGHGG